jgi:hypothetical protein
MIDHKKIETIQDLSIELRANKPIPLTPIVLFVYNRPWHTQQTVAALQQNELASESELFIYSDAPKTEQEQVKVQEVRDYIHLISGFKKVTIIEREENWGLADSIIDGVTNIVNQYEKIIVLEDDLVTSPHFLRFMNEALNIYMDEKKVMHISAYNLPITPENISETFFYRASSCWGWATWRDRWTFFEKDADKIVKQFSLKDIYHFNVNGSYNFWSHLIANKQKKLNTWAIFWYANIFLEDGLCLHPSVSLVANIGHDGSGKHCGDTIQFDVELSQKPVTEFFKSIDENSSALNKIINFYRKDNIPFWCQLRMIKSYLIGKLL